MNPVRTVAVAAAALITLVLTACGGPSQPPIAKSYDNLDAVRAAAMDAGAACDRWAPKPPGVLDAFGIGSGDKSGDCNDGPVVKLTWYAESATVTDFQQMEAKSATWNDPNTLWGPNWQLWSTDEQLVEQLRGKLGGTLQSEIKPS